MAEPSQVNTFGTMTPAAMAGAVMDRISDQSMPSPSQPLRVPAGKLAVEYGRLYDAARKLEKLEPDSMRLLKIAEIKQFADQVLVSITEEQPYEPEASGAQPAAGVPAPAGPAPGAPPQPTAAPAAPPAIGAAAGNPSPAMGPAGPGA